MSWINANDEMPPVVNKGQTARVLAWVCMVTMNGGCVHYCKTAIHDQEWHGSGWFDDELTELAVTHWQPLPEGPEEQE